MKPSFLNHSKPLLCAMVLDSTPDKMITNVISSLYAGAEAFGFQLDCLEREYRTKENLKKIFAACGDHPIYITSYRSAFSAGMSDEECAELLLLGVECGATIADIMTDMFCPSQYEYTKDEAAVEKQKALAKKIHDMGCEVLFSAHVGAFLPEEMIVEIARAQEERGADVCKIVSRAETEEQLIEDIGICARLKQNISKKYLFLAGGKHCRLLRQITGRLGSCMYLCTVDYERPCAKEQPLLYAQKAIRDHMVY